jgi:hypothetical protein
VTVTGDDLLLAAYTQFSDDIGTAFNQTLAIKGPITTLAGETLSSFQAIGDVGAGGAACVASTLSGAGNITASLNVSVSASASVSGSTS